MKRNPVLFSLVVLVITACGAGQPVDPATIVTPISDPVEYAVQADRLPLHVTWQIQYSGDMEYSLRVEMFNLDLFETDPAVIADLRARGVFVMCYFSAGSMEEWRPDAGRFPPEVLGGAMAGWEGEWWLDVRRIDEVGRIMEDRLDLARHKGCDGVDPDNVNGYENAAGFPLTAADQIAYNVFLADAAHARGLSIGLKNDLDQIPDLIPYFDWALNEECFSYGECHPLVPFIEAGKPVFVIEYELSPVEFCGRAEEMGFNALHKNRELDAYRASCD